MEPETPFHGPCRALAVHSAYSVAALDLTMIEVANVLGVRYGRRDDAIDVCRLMIGRCRRLTMSADPGLVPWVLDFAREHRLSAYDASYVAAAEREGLTLVSLDIKDLVSKGLAVTPDAAV